MKRRVWIFLISIKAGGFGVNLTAADYVFILDPWWNPAVEMQAIDRTHRIGQQRRVFTYRFITRDSVEEKRLKMVKEAIRNLSVSREEAKILFRNFPYWKKHGEWFDKKTFFSIDGFIKCEKDFVEGNDKGF